MSIRLLDNITIISLAGLAPAATTVRVSVSDAARLNSTLLVGDIVYFVATDTLRQEVMKYTHTAVISGATPELVIVRGQLGTVAKTWGISTCLKTILTEGVLNALICQKIRQGC